MKNLPKMISYSRQLLLSMVQKISVKFRCDIGNAPFSVTGTGFWLVSKKGGLFFVTNRHNIDPTMCNRSSSYSIYSITILLRAFSLVDNKPCGNVKELEHDANEVTIYYPENTADVVLLSMAELQVPSDQNYQLTGIHESSMSNYSRKPELFDQLFFVGFPGKNRINAAYDMPIVRSCSIASFPEIDYSDEDKTIGRAKTCLVDGLSFGGSSGSPVIREANGVLELFGIMSGHFLENKTWCDSHSGLSYFTTVEAILNIVKENGL